MDMGNKQLSRETSKGGRGLRGLVMGYEVSQLQLIDSDSSQVLVKPLLLSALKASAGRLRF